MYPGAFAASYPMIREAGTEFVSSHPDGMFGNISDYIRSGAKTVRTTSKEPP